MTRRLHLAAKHRALLEQLLQNHMYGVDVWAYGSRVNGRSHEGSDLDLVLRGPGLEKIALERLMDFEEAVRDSDIPFLVEARDWARLPERFQREIEREYVVVVGGCDEPRADWPRSRIGDLVTVHKEQITPSSFHDNLFAHHSIPAYDDGQVSSVEPGSRIKSNKFTVPSDAVLVSRLNPQFPRVWSPDIVSDQRAICSTEFLVLRPGTLIDRRFLHHLCMSPSFRTSLLARVTGTSGSHQRVSPQSLLEIEVSVPPLPEQRAIAHILGTLDDKIELNRRLNETLEAMARALFKSWFVDFDPVRAKMEGRDTGLPEDIAGLFPDRLVNSEMGEIPEGWEVATLGDMAALRREGVDPASVASDTPYIGLADMPRGSIALPDWGATGSVSSRKSVFKAGDFLFGKLRPYFHKVGIAPVDGLCSTDIVVLGARLPKWSALVLACVSSSAFVAHTSQTATGTKMPRTSWKAMSRYKLCRPTDTVATEFQRIVSPMLLRIVGNIHESRTLAALRDTLLPKLISGEMRAPEASKVEAVP